MASPEHKKHKTEGRSEGVPGPQGLPRAVPTLGDVAQDEDFEPLRGLLQPLMNRPVNELSEGLRAQLRQDEDKPTKLRLEAFFAACEARAQEAAPKRSRVAFEEEEAPGRHKSFPLPFFFFVPNAVIDHGRVHIVCDQGPVCVFRADL